MCAAPISAAEPSGQATPWNEDDAAWEQTQLAGLRALASGDVGAAAAFFQAALQMARRAFDRDDPRLATSLVNHAVVLRGRGDSAAAALLHEAGQIWQRAEAWLTRQPIAPRARSSTFHLRLERKHAESYRTHRHAELAAMLAIGRQAVSKVVALDEVRPEVALQRWQERRPATYDGARRLIAAVWLTANRSTDPAGL